MRPVGVGVYGWTLRKVFEALKKEGVLMIKTAGVPLCKIKVVFLPGSDSCPGENFPFMTSGNLNNI